MPLGEHTAFAPTLAAVGRVRAGLLPAERRFDHRAIHRQPGPIDPAQFVKLFHPGLPQAEEDAGAHPLLEAVMRGRVGAQVRLVQRLPLAAGAQHIEDGIGTDPGGRPRAPATKPVGVDVGGEQGLQHRPHERQRKTDEPGHHRHVEIAVMCVARPQAP